MVSQNATDGVQKTEVQAHQRFSEEKGFFWCSLDSRPDSRALGDNSEGSAAHAAAHHTLAELVLVASQSLILLSLPFLASFVISGKKKAHKHKSFWPATPPMGGGSPGRAARGQRFMCYPWGPRNINLFARVPNREDR